MDFKKTTTIHIDIEDVADRLADYLDEVFLEDYRLEKGDRDAIDDNKVLLAIAQHWLKNLY